MLEKLDAHIQLSRAQLSANAISEAPA